MSKIININPSLFNFAGKGGTRKKQPANPNIQIKVKEFKDKENNKTTKRALLKYIRSQQEKNIEKNMQFDKAATPAIIQPAEIDNFNTNFDESLKFLTKIAEQNIPVPIPQTQYNRTMKNNQAHNLEPIIYNQLPENLEPNVYNQPHNLEQYSQIDSTASPITINAPKIQFPISQYGCLKGGALPTYRKWMTQTQKNVQPIVQQPRQSMIQHYAQPPVHSTVQSIGHPSVHPSVHSTVQPPISNRELELNRNIQKMSEIKQLNAKYNKHPSILHYPKQKRTVLRTYTVGKSKVFPKISVLVSNKTIRNNITTKSHLLKQVTITDVKKYLIKHGFIRVGTVAPNDVLRKMYESAILICGNINNHNPDNLLYNYMNDKS